MDARLLSQMVAMSKTDGEFRLNAAGWSGSVHLAVADKAWLLEVEDGELREPRDASATLEAADGRVSLRATPAVWKKLLQAVPAPAFTDPWGASLAGMEIDGVHDARRHAAVRRLAELLRHASNGTDASPQTLPNRTRHGQHDHAVGRYIHLDIDDVDYRLYYEEAGQGIPLICQHTAGSDGRQWRHLFEDDRITSNFRVIAYDLPYHGKSLPPESKPWWAEEYRLTTDFAMKVPTTLGKALHLERPVFIGSSIGGMLALDLARYYADYYRAVISLEGGLRSGSDPSVVPASMAEAMANTDPAVHAELMMMVMASPAPQAYRQEARLHYAQGAPGVFLGDVFFYAVDHDLRQEAHLIDTAKCAVYLLTGEYDVTTVPISEAAAAAIRGSEYRLMKGLGHFPMSEDPVQFAAYLLPVLEKLAANPDL